MNMILSSVKPSTVSIELIQPSLRRPVFQRIATAVGVIAIGIIDTNVRIFAPGNFILRSTARSSAIKYSITTETIVNTAVFSTASLNKSLSPIRAKFAVSENEPSVAVNTSLILVSTGANQNSA